MKAGRRLYGERAERDGDTGRDAGEQGASLPWRPERKEDHLVKDPPAGIHARDASLEVFAGAACRAVLDGPAPVAAPAPAAARERGQQRLPV